MFEKIREDMNAYEDTGGFYKELGFWITATYRFGHWAHGIENKPAKVACLVAHKAMATPWRFFRNVYLPAKADIGGGLRMVHPQNVLVPPDCRIGKNVSLYHEVTLGTGHKAGVPELGDNVEVFAGAKLLGGIRVGSNVQVGANAVVIRDVPDGATVVAPPSRAVPAETSKIVRT